jgi:hypothetical protein
MRQFADLLMGRRSKIVGGRRLNKSAKIRQIRVIRVRLKCAPVFWCIVWCLLLTGFDKGSYVKTPYPGTYVFETYSIKLAPNGKAVETWHLIRMKKFRGEWTHSADTIMVTFEDTLYHHKDIYKYLWVKGDTLKDSGGGRVCVKKR